ncbi:MAG: DUF2934 domain-containing protein [Planctomycetes bacterium]|nr:DUF2934 domain-containing protein [Planctomycetota bacterium]
MSKKNSSPAPVSQHDIEARAYAIYLGEDCPEGRCEQHWLQAEQQLLAAANNGHAKAKAAPKAHKTRNRS